MTDLTERLRASVTYQYMPMNVRKMLSEAATTLETLTEENARLREALSELVDECDPDGGAIYAPSITCVEDARKALGGGDE